MNAQTERRVWIGCLACYNDGRLTGMWYPARSAGEVSTSLVHTHAGIATTQDGYVIGEEVYGPHEELWVMDHEGLPITGECSPHEAQAVAEVCDAIEADGHPVDAVRAWAENMGEGFPEEWDRPTREAFEDSYNGRWASFIEYAQELAESIGATGTQNEWPLYCIDWERAAHDLSMDYWTEDAPGGGVYVFRSI